MATFGESTINIGKAVQKRFRKPNGGGSVPIGSGTSIAQGSGAYLPPANNTPIIPQTSVSGSMLNPLLDRLNAVDRNQIANIAPLAPQFEGMAPVPVRRPDPSYFSNLFATKIAPVENQFFGAGGVSDQAVGEANRRGFMTGGPSGVAGQLYGQTVSDPFARAATEVENQVNVIRGEIDLQLSQFDATAQQGFQKFMGDMKAADRAYGIDKATAQSNIDNNYFSLLSDITGKIATGTTTEELARLENNLKTYELISNQRLAEKELALKKDLGQREQTEKERAARAEEFITGMQVPGFYDQFTFDSGLGLPRPSSGPGSKQEIPKPFNGTVQSVGTVAGANQLGAPLYSSSRRFDQMNQPIQTPGQDGGLWEADYGGRWRKIA